MHLVWSTHGGSTDRYDPFTKTQRNSTFSRYLDAALQSTLIMFLCCNNFRAILAQFHCSFNIPHSYSTLHWIYCLFLHFWIIIQSTNRIRTLHISSSSSIGTLARCGLWPVLPFFPICHQLSPSSHFQHLNISFYFLFPAFPGSSPSSRPFHFLSEDLFGHPILLHSLQVT